MPRGFSLSALNRNSSPGGAGGKQLSALFMGVTQWEKPHFSMRKAAARCRVIALKHDLR
jgi:hypothetical protein